MIKQFIVKQEVANSVWLEARTPEDWPFNEKGLMDHHPQRFEVFRVTDHSEFNIGYTYFSPFPGCCGAVVSHHTYLNPDSRHSGLSEPFRKLKEKIAKEMGYPLMVATTDMENIPAVGNFFKSGYNIVQTWMNKRTGHLLALGIKKVK